MAGGILTQTHSEAFIKRCMNRITKNSHLVDTKYNTNYRDLMNINRRPTCHRIIRNTNTGKDTRFVFKYLSGGGGSVTDKLAKLFEDMKYCINQDCIIIVGGRGYERLNQNQQLENYAQKVFLNSQFNVSLMMYSEFVKLY